MAEGERGELTAWWNSCLWTSNEAEHEGLCFCPLLLLPLLPSAHTTCVCCPRCAPVVLFQMTTTLEPYQILWTTVSQFYDKYSLWMNGPFIKLNPEEVEADTNEAFRCRLRGRGRERKGNAEILAAHRRAWRVQAGLDNKAFRQVLVQTALGLMEGGGRPEEPPRQK